MDLLAPQSSSDGEPLPAYSVIAAAQPDRDLSEGQQIAMRYAARLCGLQPLLSGHGGLHTVRLMGVSDGDFDPYRPVFGAVRRYEPGEYQPLAGTPAEVDEYFITIRAAAPAVRLSRRCVPFLSNGGSFFDLSLQGRDDLAEQWVRANPMGVVDAEFWVALGHGSFHVGDYAVASRRARQALAIDDDNSNAWVLVARLRLQQGEIRTAIEAAERAVRIDPAIAAPYHLLSECYLALGDTRRADEMATVAAARGIV
jgi:tetratricopeptide (TPR) repeat protein